MKKAKSILNNEAGYSLLELVSVLAIIGILAAIALPNYHRAIQQAKESVLKENLYWMRDAIDQYYLDFGKYPESLNKLTEENYLRNIPTDTMTDKKNWRVVFEDYDEFEDPDFEPGIKDVKSRSRKKGLDGKRYSAY